MGWSDAYKKSHVLFTPKIYYNLTSVHLNTMQKYAFIHEKTARRSVQKRPFYM